MCIRDSCTPSRFLDEIPDDLLEKETARPRPVVTNRRPAPDTARRSSTFGSAPERSTLSIAVGSRVLHPVFGEGVVVASQAMGNDTPVSYTHLDVYKRQARSR